MHLSASFHISSAYMRTPSRNGAKFGDSFTTFHCIWRKQRCNIATVAYVGNIRRWKLLIRNGNNNRKICRGSQLRETVFITRSCCWRNIPVSKLQVYISGCSGCFSAHSLGFGTRLRIKCSYIVRLVEQYPESEVPMRKFHILLWHYSPYLSLGLLFYGFLITHN
jgi:hypothetical protein